MDPQTSHTLDPSTRRQLPTRRTPRVTTLHWSAAGLLTPILLTLAGCASHTATTHASANRGATHTNASTRSFREQPLRPSLRAVAAQAESGIYPQCTDTIGLPTEVIVHGHNVTTGAPEVRCLTGASDNDSTDVAKTLCISGPFKGAALYFWATRNPTASDQHVYVGHDGGTVTVASNVTAAQVWRRAPTAGISDAAGC